MRRAPGLENIDNPHPPGADSEHAVVQTVWARLFMEALKRAGVTHAVISPGSRSTPYTLAAEHAGLVTHTIIDERSAGFAALGMARATGHPAALICTSGSAAAHYYPAVIEAAYAFVPLVIVTADRPPELHGCAAAQTIDQSKLFGDHVRMYCDLGAPEGARSSLRALVRKAVQALARARAPMPGPVHINAPARKPLEPARPETPAEIAMIQRGDEILGSVQTRAALAPMHAAGDIITSLAQACRAAQRGLIVAGPALPGPALADAAYALTRATGFPLLTEAASQLRFARAAYEAASPARSTPGRDPGPAPAAALPAALPMIDAFDLLLGSARFRRQARPDLIIQLGPPPISSAWDIYQAENPDCVRCVIAAHGWNDPHSSADLMVFADPADTAARVAAELGELPPRQGREAAALRAWAACFAAGNQLGWDAVAEVLSQARRGGAMREGEAMRAAVSALPGGTLLALGNSLPIRTIDIYCSSHSARVDVMSQRGANGIDGLISGAAGAARALRPARPVALILGDVSFVHDVGGLYAAAACDSPLAIIVIDNRGGRIFDQLPIARARYGTSPELYAAHWLTPPGCDIAAAAAMFGLAHARARTPEELTAAVTTAGAHRGATIIHAEVEPDSAAADRRRIGELVDAGVASLPVLAEIPANDSFEEV